MRRGTSTGCAPSGRARRREAFAGTGQTVEEVNAAHHDERGREIDVHDERREPPVTHRRLLHRAREDHELAAAHEGAGPEARDEPCGARAHQDSGRQQDESEAGERG